MLVITGGLEHQYSNTARPSFTTRVTMQFLEVLVLCLGVSCVTAKHFTLTDCCKCYNYIITVVVINLRTDLLIKRISNMMQMIEQVMSVLRETTKTSTKFL
jgi:hypothetical protein